MSHVQSKPTTRQNVPTSQKKKERRTGFRTKVLQAPDIQAELRCGKNQSWLCKPVNLSLQGILLEFPKDCVPLLRVDERVSVKLAYDADSVWVPGIVRHRPANRVGIRFPEYVDPGANTAEQVIARILKAVQPGRIRQKSH